MKLNLLNKSTSLFPKLLKMMQNNNYSLTDDEFFASHPQPSLLSCVYNGVYQVEPRPDPHVTEQMMQKLADESIKYEDTHQEEDGMSSQEEMQSLLDKYNQIYNSHVEDEEDLSDYLTEEEMQAGSDRLDQINKEALEQIKLNALLEKYFKSSNTIYDTELEVYLPVLSEPDSEIPLTYEGLMQWNQKEENKKSLDNMY